MSDTAAETYYRDGDRPALPPELREANMRVIRAARAAIAEPSQAALRAVERDVLGHMHEAAEAARLRAVARSAPDVPPGRIDAAWADYQTVTARLAAAGGQPGSGTEQDRLARAAQWQAARNFQATVRALVAAPASVR